MRFLKEKIKAYLNINPWNLSTYSQEGEDRILLRAFESKSIGTYIDVGAHHPFRFSNTYLFYKKGWRGINIDATPGSMDNFKKHRKNDINLECGIGNREEVKNFYVFNEPALNGFSKELSEKRDKESNLFKIKKIIPVQIFTLSSVLDHHLSASKQIDFLTIDTEGSDYDVLLSNDWNKYRPQFVLVESLITNLSDIINNKFCLFMKEVGYNIYAKTINTLFFKKNE